MTFNDSVDKFKFKAFVGKLKESNQNVKICIYFDNLAVHRSKFVRDYLDELSIPYIFCPPYSPDFNGIESVFSIFKNKLRRRRLQMLVKREKIDLEEETHKIFNEIDKSKIEACIDFSLRKLFNFNK